MPSSPHVICEQKERVLSITLDRPKVNALDAAMLASLQEALQGAARDPQVRCVLLSARGAAFSAGQDIGEAEPGKQGAYRAHLLTTYNPLIAQIRRLEKPVMAAIQGPVSGAALGIVLACDLRIAAEEARFIVAFLGIGLGLDSAVSLLLPATIGLGRAMECALCNAPVSASQALEWGLVNRVVPGAELHKEAERWANELAQGPTRTMGLAKRAFNKAVLGNLEGVLDYEAHLQEIASHTSEHREGLSAFLERRAPRYSTQG
ncbi:MAG: enoyl-CoA hydratase-related protein [Anaerolineales bacterium]|nr:enoyl-CoA hydratase-related protein [Anaerolineales bacterium]